MFLSWYLNLNLISKEIPIQINYHQSLKEKLTIRKKNATQK